MTRFVAGPVALAAVGGRRPSLPAALGRFVASACREGGLQSVPLLQDDDDLACFERVVALIAETDAGRVNWGTRPGQSMMAAARRAQTAAGDQMSQRLQLAKHINALVDAAPPLSVEQKVSLSVLLAPAKQTAAQAIQPQQVERERLYTKVRAGTFRIVGGAGQVRLWWDGSADFGWQLSEHELAARFVDSPFSDGERWPWPVEQVLAHFVREHEDRGGLQSIWLTDATAADRLAHRDVIGLITSAAGGALSALDHLG